MAIRFVGTCLISDDVAKLAAFYAMLLEASVEGDADFASVATDGGALSICSTRLMERLASGSGSDTAGAGTVVEFEVDEVDRWFERLVAAGVPVVKAPATYQWGRRSAWFRDPSGTIINLCQLTSPSNPTDHDPEGRPQT